MITALISKQLSKCDMVYPYICVNMCWYTVELNPLFKFFAFDFQLVNVTHIKAIDDLIVFLSFFFNSFKVFKRSEICSKFSKLIYFVEVHLLKHLMHSKKLIQIYSSIAKYRSVKKEWNHVWKPQRFIFGGGDLFSVVFGAKLFSKAIQKETSGIPALLIYVKYLSKYIVDSRFFLSENFQFIYFIMVMTISYQINVSTPCFAYFVRSFQLFPFTEGFQKAHRIYDSIMPSYWKSPSWRTIVFKEFSLSGREKIGKLNTLQFSVQT